MIGEVSPGLILIVGALLVPLLRGPVRAAYMLALPVLAFWQLIGLDYGEFGHVQMLNLTLVTLRVDSLSVPFGYVFLIATLLGVIYAMNERDTVQYVAGLIYAGSALGAVFAGDLVTLFIFWEALAVSSAFLVWAGRNRRAYGAGVRYLVIQIGSGVLLLAGVLFHYRATGSIAFGSLSLSLGAPGATLIFIAFGIKCAFPFLHNWLQDAYPESTASGAVILSAFSTKVAVYALARGFAGTEILVPIGVAMTLFPIFYAVIENDLRRVLAYSLNNQLGYMVVGIGIGTELAINGTVGHAFVHVLYKALLFMSMGAVLVRLGTVKGSELGGLYKSMPWTAGFCIVGAASISAVPLFSGFITKSLILGAAIEQGYFWTWIALLVASAGVLHYCGIKVPYFAFFGRDSGKRCAEAPAGMLIAMAAAAALCIGIGLYPAALYDILPFPVTYQAYTLDHVVGQAQLLLFSALAFAVLIRTGLYPRQVSSTNLDFDWVYRRLGRTLALETGRIAAAAWEASVAGTRELASRSLTGIAAFARDSALARDPASGTMAMLAMVCLVAYLIVEFLR